MRAMTATMRTQGIALMGVVERNSYLVKRYGWWEAAFFLWTVANTLTVVFIAKGVEATGGRLDVERQTASLLIGAVIWSYLGVVFEILTETVAWERWEGTIEYTFMAPLPRGAPARHGRVRRALRRAADRGALRRRGAVLRPVVPGRELRRGAAAARGRVGVVRRRRHGDRGAAADLAREGRPARVRRPGHAARRERRLLPGRGHARLDAGARDDLAGDVRAARHPRGGARRRGRRRGVGRGVAAHRARRRGDPGRPRGVPVGRALRQAP